MNHGNGAKLSRGSVRRVAVLGAGIMGSCLALLLSRRGIDVTLFDVKQAPMSGASRWNEGKIHLGYLYAADPTLETARRVIPGALAFGPILSGLLGQPITESSTAEDDIYLVHADSVVPIDDVRRYLNAVCGTIGQMDGIGGYLCDITRSHPRQISRIELDRFADTRTIIGGFRVPERSVRTGRIADLICEALACEPRITQSMSVRVTGTTPVGPADGPWRVVGKAGVNEIFDVVVNALWHGRLAIDRSAGLAAEGEWSNRYRVSIFASTSKPIDVPSAIAVVGPFGDIKNYNGEEYYLSWYPAGLLAESTAESPEEPASFGDTEMLRLVREIVSGLETVIPRAGEVIAHATNVVVDGGFVFAMGQGSLADRRATLHRRDKFGVRRHGHYFSVDTGKYSTAPWLARSLAAEILGD